MVGPRAITASNRFKWLSGHIYLNYHQQWTVFSNFLTTTELLHLKFTTSMIILQYNILEFLKENLSGDLTFDQIPFLFAQVTSRPYNINSTSIVRHIKNIILYQALSQSIVTVYTSAKYSWYCVLICQLQLLSLLWMSTTAISGHYMPKTVEICSLNANFSWYFAGVEEQLVEVHCDSQGSSQRATLAMLELEGCRTLRHYQQHNEHVDSDPRWHVDMHRWHH